MGIQDDPRAYHRWSRYVVGGPVDYTPDEPTKTFNSDDFCAWCRRTIGRALRPGDITLQGLLWKEYRKR